MKRIWFKAKDYGWGWYPATWQGWIILLVFLLLFTLNIFRLQLSQDLTNLLIWYLPETLLLVAVLIFICYLTGEKPEWRWAGKPIKKKEKK